MTPSTPRQIAERAKEASHVLADADPAVLAATLETLARLLEGSGGDVLEANRADVAAARQAGLPDAKVRRLELDPAAVGRLAASVRRVALLPSPQGEVTQDRVVAESGLRVRKVRMPLGVIAMIYEARPGVTVDAFSLCLRSGNASILKGGREAVRSNRALFSLIGRALVDHGLPPASATLVESTDRDQIAELLACEGLIDLAIPRGGPELVSFVRRHARVPVLAHDRGVCHVFVHEAADLDMAERVCVSAKTSAPATCNAAECVLVDAAIAERFLPRLCGAMAARGVEVRGDEATQRICPGVTPASASDFGAEFLSLVVAVRVVNGLDGAVDHIRRHGSSHTEAILTEDAMVQEAFAKRVHASCVVINASTRNNDGGALGLGAEIGISTSRLHAYGPMGLAELTTQRFIVSGRGQTR
jgi:glutamate-5-semialdehyde dehydrogenase